MSAHTSNRRQFLQNIGLGTAAIATLPIFGCGDKDDDTGGGGGDGGATVNDDWEAMAADLEAAGIFTPDDPGEWEGKEGSHTPSVSASGTSVTVVTDHGMSVDEDHWIDHIYLRDQDGVVVGLQMFDGTEAEASSTFSLPEGTTSVTPYSSCNLHGLWMGDTIDV